MLLAAYQMCWALWYGTAEEKCPRPICAFGATIGAAICAEQSSANSQADYVCHNARHKTLLGGEISLKLAGLFAERREAVTHRKGRHAGEVLNGGSERLNG